MTAGAAGRRRQARVDDATPDGSLDTMVFTRAKIKKIFTLLDIKDETPDGDTKGKEVAEIIADQAELRDIYKVLGDHNLSKGGTKKHKINKIVRLLV